MRIRTIRATTGLTEGTAIDTDPAYPRFATHHLQAIETLRGAQKAGKEEALEELHDCFADEETRLQWAFIEDYGRRRYRGFQEWKSSRRRQPRRSEDVVRSLGSGSRSTAGE